jgi:hypothetical protein
MRFKKLYHPESLKYCFQLFIGWRSWKITGFWFQDDQNHHPPASTPADSSSSTGKGTATEDRCISTAMGLVTQCGTVQKHQVFENGVLLSETWNGHQVFPRPPRTDAPETPRPQPSPESKTEP